MERGFNRDLAGVTMPQPCNPDSPLRIEELKSSGPVTLEITEERTCTVISRWKHRGDIVLGWKGQSPRLT